MVAGTMTLKLVDGSAQILRASFLPKAIFRLLMIKIYSLLLRITLWFFMIPMGMMQWSYMVVVQVNHQEL